MTSPADRHRSHGSVSRARYWKLRVVKPVARRTDHKVFDLSKSSGVSSAEGVEEEVFGEGVSPPTGEGLSPYFFYLKIVHFGAFSYTNSKVLFAIKCREMFVITVFLATDSATEMKTSKFSSIS